VTASSFVRREFNVLPPRRGPSAGLPAEGPGLLSNSAPSSGTQVTTQVEASRAGMSQPAGAPAAVAAPREIPIDSPPTGRGASALEREGASLLAIGLCAVLLVIGGGVIWLIAAGYSDIIIIFDDWADFGLSFLAAFCVIVGFAVAVVSLRPDGTWTGFLASLAVIAAGIAAGYRSFTLAFNNNGKGALGVTVGVFKIFAGLLIVVGIFGHGSTLLDRKARVSEQIRSAILLAAFTALAYALVNGKRVREKRAASMAGAAAAAP
jgi:hypothetical protein